MNESRRRPCPRMGVDGGSSERRYMAQLVFRGSNGGRKTKQSACARVVAAAETRDVRREDKSGGRGGGDDEGKGGSGRGGASRGIYIIPSLCFVTSSLSSDPPGGNHGSRAGHRRKQRNTRARERDREIKGSKGRGGRERAFEKNRKPQWDRRFLTRTDPRLIISPGAGSRNRTISSLIAVTADH